MVNSRRKGKDGELELKEHLSALLGIDARRTQQYCGVGAGDVVGIPGVHIECKRTNVINIYKFMQQARRDAKDHEVPMVCCRKDRGEWLLVIPLEHLPDLAERINELNRRRTLDDE